MATDDSATTLESPEAVSDLALDPQGRAYFPRRFITEFFQFLKQHQKIFQVLTYADLPWGDDIDYKRNYPIEWRNWTNQLQSGERDPNKIYIVLQYDVDTSPDRTMSLLQEPAHESIPANVMIFNRRVDRRRLKNTGVLALTAYELDIEMLKRLEKNGFVVGYHTNAYERAGFDLDGAIEIFDADVKELSRSFNIRFFSAHGGEPDAKGRNNRDLPFHPNWINRLKWVNNGHTVRFNGIFSDGGHNSMQRDPLHRDLRTFVAKLEPGGRYGILLHPQYYGNTPRISPRFRGTQWYDDLMQTSRSGGSKSLWENVLPVSGSPSFMERIQKILPGRL